MVKLEILFLIGFINLFAIWLILRTRNLHIWILPYIVKGLITRPPSIKHKHIYVCLADHFEPYVNQADRDKAHARINRWVREYTKVAREHSDSTGRSPQHSYFYPAEEYDEWIMEQIKAMCVQGLGDLDIHLHHDNDTPENLEATLNRFKTLLHVKHGFLRKNQFGDIVYGFIHGNWALDNSRPDGKWCGIDNEIDVLLRTGCVFDMTMPSAPSNTQTKTINSIYLAQENGHRKSHDSGRRLEVGSDCNSNELLMIQGPLTLDWKNRKFGLFPRIEAGEISYDSPPKPSRVKLWENCSVNVKGAEEHIFIKLHTHGLEEQNTDMLFNLNGFDTLWTALETQYKNQKNYTLHYVSAWEMYQNIKRLASGQPLG